MAGGPPVAGRRSRSDGAATDGRAESLGAVGGYLRVFYVTFRRGREGR